MNCEKEDFILYLMIEDTGYEDVEVKISDLSLPIHQQIDSIVKVFNLPNKKGSMYVTYILGLKDNYDITVLDADSSFLDYNIQPYDTIICTAVPVPNRSIDFNVSIEYLGIKSLEVTLVLYDTMLDAIEKILNNVPINKLLRLGSGHYICFPNRIGFETYAPLFLYQNEGMDEETFNEYVSDECTLRLIDCGITERTKLKIDFVPLTGSGVSLPIKVTNHALTTKQIVIEEMKRNGYKRCKGEIGHYFCPLYFESTIGNGPTRMYAFLSTNYNGTYDEMCKDQRNGIFKPLSNYSVDTNIFYVIVTTFPFVGESNFIGWIKKRFFQTLSFGRICRTE